jgi:hypothetical protein
MVRSGSWFDNSFRYHRNQRTTILTTTRFDVLVLGSTLGGLVAASYLARAGLRVGLIEEQVGAKQPALLREPFLLSGLESGGWVMRALRELGVPLLEQRQLERKSITLQVILPQARIDVPRGSGALARELEAHRLADARTLRAWLGEIDRQGVKAQTQLWDRPEAGPCLHPAGHLPSRLIGDVRVRIRFPTPPVALAPFVRAQIEALSSLQPAMSGAAPALLLHSTRGGAFQMPDAETSFLSLLRRRFSSLYGEIHAVGSFDLLRRRSEVEVASSSDRFLARALVIAVPREPLRGFLAKTSGLPAWLKPTAPPLETPSRLFRVARRSLPAGMTDRVIRAEFESPDQIHWLSRTRDPEDPETEWITAAGPGAGRLPARDPLGALAPFSGETIVPVDPGPPRRWDRDGGDLRFQRPRIPVWLKRRPLIVTVGPELAPELGFQGEVLCARRVALHLARRLSRT